MPEGSHDDASPLMTADELATWLACTRRAVYDRVFRGQIPGVLRVGRRLYFRRAEILHWLGLQSAATRPRSADVCYVRREHGGLSAHARSTR